MLAANEAEISQYSVIIEPVFYLSETFYEVYIFHRRAGILFENDCVCNTQNEAAKVAEKYLKEIVGNEKKIRGSRSIDKQGNWRKELSSLLTETE